MKRVPRAGDLPLDDVSTDDDLCAEALEGLSHQVEPAQGSAEDLLFEERLLDMALCPANGTAPDSALPTPSITLDSAATTGHYPTSGVHVFPAMGDYTDDDLCLEALEALAREVESPGGLEDRLLDLALDAARCDGETSTISTLPSVDAMILRIGAVPASGVHETSGERSSPRGRPHGFDCRTADRAAERAAYECLSTTSCTSSPAPESLIADKYRLLRQLGEGPMGRVWVAVNESTSRRVALKFLRRTEPRIRERILRESLAFGTLQHRNVIDVHDVVETKGGDLILVMPLLAGETLGDLLGRERRLDSPAAARIARELALALDSLHAARIILRGLTPSSIFLQCEPVPPSEVTVKLLDLDLGGSRTDAATGGPGDPSSSLSAYQSPELMAATEVDCRTDIWTLGIIMFEMLTGQVPFRGDAAQIIAAIQQGEAPPVSRLVRSVAPDLVDLVSACLQRDRARRPSLLELADGLAPFTGLADPTRVAQLRSIPPPDREPEPGIEVPGALHGASMLLDEPEASTVPGGSSILMLPFFGSSAAGSWQSNDEILRSRVLPGDGTATIHQTLAQSRRVSTIIILIACSVVSLTSIAMVVGIALHKGAAARAKEPSVEPSLEPTPNAAPSFSPGAPEPLNSSAPPTAPPVEAPPSPPSPRAAEEERNKRRTFGSMQ